MAKDDAGETSGSLIPMIHFTVCLFVCFVLQFEQVEGQVNVNSQNRNKVFMH